MNLKFMRPHMRYPEPEYFDLFVSKTERLIERHREAFSPEEENEYLTSAHDEYRKTLQRQLEALRKENRACDGALDVPIVGLEEMHKDLIKSKRAQEIVEQENLINGIIQLFTAATTGLKVSKSEGAVLPVYAREIYTEIFGAKWEEEKKLRNGPWVGAIDKYMKRNK